MDVADQPESQGFSLACARLPQPRTRPMSSVLPERTPVPNYAEHGLERGNGGSDKAGDFAPPLMQVAAAYWINIWGPRYL